MATIGDTELAPTKQEIIASLVQKELISESILLPTVMDVSRFAVKGAKQISFPRRESFVAEDRASGVEGTKQDPSFSKDTLDLNFVANVTWIVDPQDEIESVVDLDSENAQGAARAHAVFIEQKLRDELETVAIPLPSATLGDITDPIILEMRRVLLKNKADRRRLRLAVSPEQEEVMLGINKFVTADNYGTSQVPSGALGTIYGMPVFISTELSAQQYFAYEESAVAIGFQRQPMLDERKAPEAGAGAMLKVLEQKFGVKGMQIGEQSAGAGESALAVKDAN